MTPSKKGINHFFQKHPITSIPRTAKMTENHFVKNIPSKVQMFLSTFNKKEY
jgi:hypothetical protein